jgi:hypothetical protein
VSLKEKLLAARNAFRREPATAPGLAELLGCGELWIREMSASERGTLEESRWQSTEDGDIVRRRLDMSADRERLLVRTLCDADGKRIFEDGDALALGQCLPGRLADDLYTQASVLNGLNRKQEDEDLEKNSTPTTSISATS